MIRLCYDPETGAPLYTLAGEINIPGSFIEIEADPGDLSAWRVEDGALVRVSIEPEREAARRALTSFMVSARSQLVTSLPGQDMIYLRKEAEAKAWLASDDPDLADYPLLSAEAGITAPDADQLAQLWLNMAAILTSRGGQLEALRMTVGSMLDAAETTDDIAAALAVIPS